MLSRLSLIVKYSATLLLVFAFCLNTKAQPSYQKLDEKNGFRDLAFGTPLSEISGLIAVNQTVMPDKLIQVYKRPSDALEIGGMPVYSIQYHFYKGILYNVSVSVVNNFYNSDGEAVKRILVREYGQGQEPYKGAMAWLGQKVWMSFSKTSEFSFLTIESKSLKDQHDAEERASYKAKPSGL